MQNFITLGQPLLGEKYVAEKKEEKKNNSKNSGHFVPLHRPRAVHALRLDQFSMVFWIYIHLLPETIVQQLKKLAYILLS